MSELNTHLKHHSPLALTQVVQVTFCHIAKMRRAPRCQKQSQNICSSWDLGFLFLFQLILQAVNRALHFVIYCNRERKMFCTTAGLFEAAVVAHFYMHKGPGLSFLLYCNIEFFDSLLCTYFTVFGSRGKVCHLLVCCLLCTKIPGSSLIFFLVLYAQQKTNLETWNLSLRRYQNALF